MAKRKAPFATVDNLKEGDVVWESSGSLFDELEDYVVYPLKVVKVNKSSFYTQRDGSSISNRHDMRTGQRADRVFGMMHTTYRSKGDFERRVQMKVEKEKLKEELHYTINRMNLEELRKAYEMLNE